MPDIIINVDASASLDYEPPVEGLSYLNFFRSEGVLGRNLVGAAATVTGAPTMGAGYAVMTGAVSYIDTGLTDDTADLTLMVLAKSAEMPTATSNSQLFIGNYVSASEANMGASIFVSGSGSHNPTGSFWSAGQALRAFVGGRIATDWAIRVLRLSEGQSVVTDLTAGIQLPASFETPRSMLNRTPFRIGWGGASFGGVSHVAAAAIAPRYLSDIEIADIAQSMRAMAAMDGIAA